jgi:hypothetical protein
MPELRFRVQSVHAVGDPVDCELAFRLHLENTIVGEQIQSISLNTELYIHPARRQYNEAEQLALQDLFGGRERWADTLRPVFWTNALATVHGFLDSTVTELTVCCTGHQENAAAKYCRAVREGDVFLELLFRGTVFYLRNGSVQVAFIPWSTEASVRIPVTLLKQSFPALHSDDPISAVHNGLRAEASADMRPAVPSWLQIVNEALGAAARRKP